MHLVWSVSAGPAKASVGIERHEQWLTLTQSCKNQDEKRTMHTAVPACDKCNLYSVNYAALTRSVVLCNLGDGSYSIMSSYLYIVPAVAVNATAVVEITRRFK